MGEQKLNTSIPSEIDWIFNYLVFRGLVKTDQVVSSVKSRKKLIAETLQQLEQLHFQQWRNEVEQIETLLPKYALEAEDFEWFDKKDRLLCVFLWGAVQSLDLAQPVVHSSQMYSKPQPLVNVEIKPQMVALGTSFHQIMGRLYLVSNEDILRACEDFFQRLGEPKGIKRSALMSLKNFYERFRYQGNSMNWVSFADVESRSWAWNYISSKGVPTDYLCGDISNLGVEHIKVAFELWNAHPAEKELLYKQLKAAASQRKTRLRRQGRKPYQIMLSEQAKKRLDKLAWDADRKIYELVEYLIDKEFNRISDK